METPTPPTIILLGYTGYIGSLYFDFLEKKKINYLILSREIIENDLEKTLGFIKQNYNNLYLINAIGYTGKPNVDACESNKTECLYVNAILPAKISDICQGLGITYCHISSGCIYNGYAKMFTEEDAPNFLFRQNNCSFYSGSKAMAEELLETNKNSYIWRLRIPFNLDLNNPRNYLVKLINYPKLVNVVNSITYIDDFVAITTEMILRKSPFGIYNITNDGAVSSKEIVDILYSKNIIKDKKQWFEGYTAFEKTIKCPRSNCLLDNSKIKKLGFNLEHPYNILNKLPTE